MPKQAKEDKRLKIFPGFIKEENLQLFLQSADVAFFSFKEILSSGSVILALSYGLPVVVPDMGCLPELTSNGAGLLYQPGDPNSIRNAIKEIKKMDLQEMRKASILISKQLCWKMIANQTLEIYRSCLDET